MWTCLAIFALAALALCCASAQREMPRPVDDLQRVTIKAGDITAVIGNHADHGSAPTDIPSPLAWPPLHDRTVPRLPSHQIPVS